MDGMPPDDFIDIDEWLDTHSTTIVRILIGNPVFRPLGEVPPEEVEDEVHRILELLVSHRIDVDLDKCSAAEAYRFLTTELLNAQLTAPPPGWGVCYSHGLFHLEPGEN